MRSFSGTKAWTSFRLFKSGMIRKKSRILFLVTDWNRSRDGQRVCNRRSRNGAVIWQSGQKAVFLRAQSVEENEIKGHVILICCAKCSASD